MGQAQLLVVGAQCLHAGDFFLWQKVGAGFDFLLDEGAVVLRWLLDADVLGRLLGLRGNLDEDEHGSTQRDFVSVYERMIADTLILHEGSIQAAEVAVQKSAVRLADDLRVLLGDDAIENLNDVVRVSADGGDGAELELAAVLAALNDNLRHA